MSKVTLNKKIVLSLLKKKINDKELEEKITMLGTSVEEFNDENLIIEVMPNRPDLLSEHGFSRALNSFLGYDKGLKKYNINNSKYKLIIENSVRNIRPFTVCAVVKDLKLDEDKIKEIIQLQEKMHLTYGRKRKKLAIGIYPLDKIKMPIRYLALNSDKIKFMPLGHKNEMSAEEILSKHETGKAYANLLDDKDKYPLFVDNENRILSMPPIINSQDAGEIMLKTRDVFIECSGFDFNTLSKCLNIIVANLSDMGGKIYSVNLKYGNKIIITPNLKPGEMKINLKNVNRLLGLNLKDNEIKNLLNRMGFDYKNKKVLIPAYRTDIMHEVDLIEDIAIAYGYDKFDIELPKITTIGEEDKFESFKNKISEFLLGLNLLEVNTFHIANSHDQNNKMLANNELVILENSLNQDYNVLRYWMIPNMLKVLKENKHNEYPQRLYEIGKVFLKNISEIKELSKLSVVTSHSETNFTEIKQILDSLFNVLNLKYEIKEEKHESFISGRTASIFIDNKRIGYLGEINPEVLERWELEMPVSCLEIDLKSLFNKLS